MSLEKTEIESKIIELGKLQAWNHNFSLPLGIETRPGNHSSHGKNSIKLKRLEPIFDAIGLSGKRIIDVGCNEGFFSQYLASNGAEDVLGIDIDEQRLLKAKYIKELIGSNLNVNFENIDIYSDEFSAIGKFDLCLCLGFLHRIPDPFTAVSRLAKKTDMIVFEWKALKFGPHDEPFAYFSQKGVNSKDYYGTEYWLLSYSALESILKMSGFEYFYRIDDSRQKRAILVAGKKPHKIFDLPNVSIGRSKIMALLSHTKRYLATIAGLFSGRVNA